jgi:uncharacterized membrane protein
MSQNKLLISAAISGVLALGAIGAGTATADEAKPEIERCAGIVKAGMNECGTSEHACAGMGKEDYGPEEWISLPKGTCDKIAGGTVLEEGEAMKM